MSAVDPPAEGDSIGDDWDLFAQIPAINRNALESGMVLDKRYEIVREIRAGGMGIVFEVLDRRWQEPPRRALKIVKLKAGFLSEEQKRQREEVIRRFRTEGEFQVRLRHDHVVRVYDCGEWDGDPYLVLDLIQGWQAEGAGTPPVLTLNDLLKSPQAVPLADSIELMLQVAQAVSAIHAAGVLHRDIKPENVFLDAQRGAGTPFIARLGDFGIARQLHPAAGAIKSSEHLSGAPALADTKTGDSAATGIGKVVGTPGYIAPELLIAAATATDVLPVITEKCDVWSFGILAYQLTAGVRPLPTLESYLQSSSSDSPEPLSAEQLQEQMPRYAFDHITDTDLREILSRCLSFDPASRLTAQQLVDYLSQWRQQQPMPWSTSTRRLALWARRNRLVVSILASLILFAVVATSFSWRLSLKNQLITKQNEDITEQKGEIESQQVQIQKTNENLTLTNQQLQATTTQLEQNVSALQQTTAEKEVATRQAQLNAAFTLDELGRRDIHDGTWLTGLPFLAEAATIREQLHESGAPDVAYSPHERFVDQVRLSLMVESAPRLIRLREFVPSRSSFASFSVIPGEIAIQQSEPALWDTGTGELTKLPLFSRPEYSVTIDGVPQAPIVLDRELGLIDLRDQSRVATFDISPVLEIVPDPQMEIVGFSRASNQMLISVGNRTAAFIANLQSKEIIWPITRTDERLTRPEGKNILSIEAATFSNDGTRLLISDPGSQALAMPSTPGWDAGANFWLNASVFAESWKDFFVNDPVVLSPDGHFLLAEDTHYQLTIYSAKTSKKLGELETSGLITDAVFAPDSQAVFTVAESGGETELQRWSLGGSSIEGPFGSTWGSQHYVGSVQRVVCSSDGWLVAVAVEHEPGMSMVHLLRSTLTEELCPPLPHAGSVRSLEFDPTGRYLLTATSDGLVRVWDLVTPLEERLTLPETTPGQLAAVPAAKVPGDREAVFKTADHHLEVYLEEGVALRLHDVTQDVTYTLPKSETVQSPVIHPTGRWVIAENDEFEGPFIWSVDKPETPPLPVVPARIWHVSAGGHVAVSAPFGADELAVWNLSGGEPERVDLKQIWPAQDATSYASVSLYHAQLSPDEKLLAIYASVVRDGAASYRVAILPLEDPSHVLLDVETSSGKLPDNAWSPDSAWLTISAGKEFVLLNTKKNSPIWKWEFQSPPEPAFHEVQGETVLLLRSAEELVYQPLANAAQEPIHRMPVNADEMEVIGETGIFTMRGSFTNDTTDLFDPLGSRLILSLGRYWTGNPRASIAIMGKYDVAPAGGLVDAATLNHPVVRLPEPDLKLAVFIKLGQLLSMTRIVKRGETAFLTAKEAEAIWNELHDQQQVLQPANPPFVERWQQLAGLEYGEIRAPGVDHLLPKLERLAESPGTPQDCCRLGIVQCRTGDFEEAVVTLQAIANEDDPRARCWEAIAHARLENVDAAQRCLSEVHALGDAVPARDRLLAEGAIAEANSDIPGAIALYQQVLDLVWVRDWIVDAALTVNDYQTAFTAYGTLMNSQLDAERWRKLAWLSLALKDYATFEHACHYLYELVKESRDFEMVSQSLNVLSLISRNRDPFTKEDNERLDWESEAWDLIDDEVDAPLAIFIKTMGQTRSSDCPQGIMLSIEGLLLDIQSTTPDSLVAPLIAASLAETCALNPRHLEADFQLPNSGETFQKALARARELGRKDLLEQLRWEYQILYQHLVDTAEETFLQSISLRLTALLNEDRTPEATQLCETYLNGPSYLSGVLGDQMKLGVRVVYAQLLAETGKPEQAAELLADVEQELSEETCDLIWSMALSHWMAGGEESYVAFCSRLLQRWRNTENLFLASQLLDTCLMQPLPADHHADLEHLLKVAAPEYESDHIQHRVRANVLLRTGNLPTAQKAYAEAEKHRIPKYGPRIPVREAIVELRLNPEERQGLDLLEESRRLLETYRNGKDVNDYRPTWGERRYLDVLLKEAQSLVPQSSAD